MALVECVTQGCDGGDECHGNAQIDVAIEEQRPEVGTDPSGADAHHQETEALEIVLDEQPGHPKGKL